MYNTVRPRLVIDGVLNTGVSGKHGEVRVVEVCVEIELDFVGSLSAFHCSFSRVEFFGSRF